MLTFIRRYRDRIVEYTGEYLKNHPVHGDRSLKWGRDSLERLMHFTEKGKAIRGSLALYIAESLGYDDAGNALRLAASLELMQSALLAHDDIMDRDRARRGAPTIHYQYAETAARYGIRDAYHYGESMGICAGDIAFFLAFELISSIDTHPKRLRRILELFGLEYARVGAAQMADVHNGSAPGPVTRKEVLSVYRFKTARYTFSMPMALGATLAGADSTLIAVLEDFGESLGILFQLKDDELGLVGDPDKLGKPVGSDIREGKKTLLYAILLEEVPVEYQPKLASIYGNPNASEPEVRGLLEWIVQNGVLRKHDLVMRKWARKAANRLEDLARYPRLAEELRGWIDYSLERKY